MIFINIFLSIISFIIPDNKGYFELKKFNSDYYFHNVISSENKLFFGTSKGVLTYNEEENLVLFDEDLVGPIEVFNGKLIAGEPHFDNYYNDLLPKNYKNSASTILLYEQNLLVTNKGDLFQFKLKRVDFAPTPSIRSISKNYLGTYEGIYNRSNGERLDFPTYTNGYIQEFEEVAMILWDGLSILKNGVQNNYFSTNGEGILFGEQILGKGRDVIEIKHPEYLITSNKGLYTINLDTEEVALIKKSDSNPFSFIRTEQNIFGTERLFFYDKNHVYQYNFITGKESILFSTKEPIVDVYSESASVYYILTDNQLLFKHLDLPRKNTVLTYNVLGHTLGKFDDILYITSNEGLSLYHLNKSKYASNVLKNEFNRLAHYTNNNILELGAINGLYVFDKSSLEELFNSYVQISPEKDNSDIMVAILSSIAIVLIIWTIVWQRRIIEDKLKPIEKINFQEQVTDYIRTDLANIDVAAICKHFKITTVKLYEKLGDIKPGEIIRKERIKMVRKMRKENLSEKEISRVTGFSVSYLKKI
jgi:hypothetical protein